LLKDFDGSRLYSVCLPGSNSESAFVNDSDIDTGACERIAAHDPCRTGTQDEDVDAGFIQGYHRANNDRQKRKRGKAIVGVDGVKKGAGGF
jgi:hypothetical protein